MEMTPKGVRVNELQLDLFTAYGIYHHPLFADRPRNIVADFLVFHEENPHVYVIFRDYCHRARAAGIKKYGAKAIVERIRWHVRVEVRGSEFKMSNNFTTYYARLLAMHEPWFLGFFDFHGVAGQMAG